MIRLIKNETVKMLLKKKVVLIVVILLIEISAFAYGQNDNYKKTLNSYTKNQGENYNWKPAVRQEIESLESKLSAGDLKEAEKRNLNIQLDKYKYYINENINPLTPTAAKFSVNLMQQAVMMLLPLLIILFAGDSVSGEFSSKTIKVLLTRAVPRWKILLSKYITLIIMSALVVFFEALISIIVSFITFRHLGLNEPIATGYRVISDNIDSTNIIELVEWQYLLLVASLCFISSICVATISFMVSIFAKSTAASIGIMMAALIGGSFMQFFISDWPMAKYFFSVNLNLPQYLGSSFKVVEGMNFVFSVCVLCVWTAAALCISFYTFCRRDVLV